MTEKETIDYLNGMKRTAEKDPDRRSVKCVEVLEYTLELLDQRKTLQNRCHIFSAGTLCNFCRMECERRGARL